MDTEGVYATFRVLPVPIIGGVTLLTPTVVCKAMNNNGL